MITALAALPLLAALAAPASAPPAEVTITLVRWPFMCTLSDPTELLIRDVAATLGDRVKVVVDNYGKSELARRAGVERFPVVFVGDDLFAAPEDFGFGANGTRGRYIPWKDPGNQRRFHDDLEALVRKRLDATGGILDRPVRSGGSAMVEADTGGAGTDPASAPSRRPVYRTGS
jgi:hypothetical protein